MASFCKCLKNTRSDLLPSEIPDSDRLSGKDFSRIKRAFLFSAVHSCLLPRILDFTCMREYARWLAKQFRSLSGFDNDLVLILIDGICGDTSAYR